MLLSSLTRLAQSELRRAAGARGWSEDAFDARERAQWPCEEKRRRAGFVIRNDSGPDALGREVLALERALAAEADPTLKAQALDHTPDAPRAAVRNLKRKQAPAPGIVHASFCEHFLIDVRIIQRN